PHERAVAENPELARGQRRDEVPQHHPAGLCLCRPCQPGDSSGVVGIRSVLDRSFEKNQETSPMKKLLVALIASAFAFTAFAQATEWRVPFITTPDEVVARMLKLAGTSAGDLVADLGSGDGRIVIAAARQFGARGLGIELDAALVASSRENARQAGVADRVSIVQGDVLRADFSQATVITVYLLPDLMRQLQPRFVAELK